MRLLVLIRSLEYGGAERQLVGLASGLAGGGTEVVVATFYAGGPLREPLERAGVPVFCLEKRSRWDVVRFGTRLRRLVRAVRPSVLHSYLDSANLIAAVIKPFCPGLRVVWGVRASNMDLSRYGWFDRAQFRLAPALAKLADLIIVNSHAGRDYAAGHGLPDHKMVVIPNGFDTEHFHPDREVGRKMRQEWGVDHDGLLVGHVGRLDPMKDHPTLLKAAALLTREREDVTFVCIGNGPIDYRSQLRGLGETLGLDTRVRWIASQSDMPAAYNAFDVMTLSSAYGEGSSNVVGEAMACGVPCVVTDVGDCRRIVGQTGHVVPPRDPVALSRAWSTILSAGPDARRRWGHDARERIVRHFDLGRLVEDTRRALFRLSAD